MTSALAWHTVGLATLVALALGLASVRAAEQAATDIPLRSLDPPVLLPDGREFKTWEAPGEFSRTYYVDQAAPGAADSNPGTNEKPFLTIGRAAELLQPGERVVVAAGIYRERVKPARGGIKTHINTNCLIRANLIVGTLHGPGIWMDWANANSRCTRNVILDTHTQFNGGIFIEASPRPNLIDSNFIWGSTAGGIYEHDSANQTFAHNFIAHGAGAAILLNGKITDRRIYGQPITDGSHRATGNVFFENAKNQVVENSKSRKSAVEANLGENITAACDMEKCELEWSVRGALPPCPALPALTHDFFNRPRQGGAATPGPFVDVPTAPTRVKLWPVLAP